MNSDELHDDDQKPGQLHAPCSRAEAARYFDVSARAIGNWIDALQEKRQPVLAADGRVNQCGLDHLFGIASERTCGGSLSSYCEQLEPPAPTEKTSTALAPIDAELVPDADNRLARFSELATRADDDLHALIERVQGSREQTRKVDDLLLQAARTRGKQVGVKLATEEYVAMEDARRKVLQKMAEIDFEE